MDVPVAVAGGGVLSVGGGVLWTMPRRRDPQSLPVVYRTARAGLRLTRARRRRLTALLVAAGDVWACVLELNAWRRARQDPPLAGYPELCRELAASGPGTFGELDSTGARSVLRRYSDAWLAAAKRRRDGDLSARFPRRRRRMVPLRWYHGTFTLDGRMLQIPVARGCPPLQVRLDRDLPYPAEQVRSITLLFDAGRLWADVTAEVPVAAYRRGGSRTRARWRGWTSASSTPTPSPGRAEHRQHHYDAKARARAAARRAPKPGQNGSRRWRQHRRRQRLAEARHRRRVRQAHHEAAKTVVTWAAVRRVATLAVGDPRGVLNLPAGRRHNRRTRDWRIGHLIRALADKAAQAGITVTMVDERGTSSTCPACRQRVPKPSGRVLTCPHCPFTGHRDLVAAANIAARSGGGTTPATVPAGVTHRRAGTHLPGVSPARRDPRRRPHQPAPPAPARDGRGVARPVARTP